MYLTRNIKSYPSREEFPEIIELAKDMEVELNDKKPLVLVENLNNIGYYPRNRQLILGKVLLKTLSHQEQRAVIAHEFAHAKKWCGIKQWHSIRLLIFLFISFLLLYCTVPQQSQIIFGFLALSMLILVFIVISYWNEYSADSVAAKKTSIESTVMALKKTTTPQKWSVEYITHPSVNKRIARLN
jgi:Zn-dependent protease with chaperone function